MAQRKVPTDGTPSPGGGENGSRILKQPVFGQPEPTADPDHFKVRHPSDGPAYKIIDQLNAEHRLKPLLFPRPRGENAEPVLTLVDVLNGDKAQIDRIQGNGQIVFHALGDCGSTRGPQTEDRVTDKMAGDFDELNPKEIPQFALLLGDIVYSFGEREYYFDQFYDPYRNYHAPVLAAAGNHDGMVSPLAHAMGLAAYLRNFCADPKDGFVVTPEAGGLSRTAQIQPGVYFTFDAPFVRILVFYSNTLEDPGYISGQGLPDWQEQFLRSALQRIKKEKYSGALLFAHHHPPYAIGGQHSSSTEMLKIMDRICEEEKVWPHAVLSGHAHSYQRFTRHRLDGTEIPYVICGNGGHNVQKLKPLNGKTLRAPMVLQTANEPGGHVDFENYDDTDYGYLRVVADAQQLRIEYHPAPDGIHTKSPDDSVTIDLARRQRIPYKANDLGYPAATRAIREAMQVKGKKGVTPKAG